MPAASVIDGARRRPAGSRAGDRRACRRTAPTRRGGAPAAVARSGTPRTRISLADQAERVRDGAELDPDDERRPLAATYAAQARLRPSALPASCRGSRRAGRRGGRRGPRRRRRRADDVAGSASAAATAGACSTTWPSRTRGGRLEDDVLALVGQVGVFARVDEDGAGGVLGGRASPVAVEVGHAAGQADLAARGGFGRARGRVTAAAVVRAAGARLGPRVTAREQDRARRRRSPRPRSRGARAGDQPKSRRAAKRALNGTAIVTGRPEAAVSGNRRRAYRMKFMPASRHNCAAARAPCNRAASRR